MKLNHEVGLSFTNTEWSNIVSGLLREIAFRDEIINSMRAYACGDLTVKQYDEITAINERNVKEEG